MVPWISLGSQRRQHEQHQRVILGSLRHCDKSARTMKRNYSSVFSRGSAAVCLLSLGEHLFVIRILGERSASQSGLHASQHFRLYAGQRPLNLDRIVFTMSRTSLKDYRYTHVHGPRKPAMRIHPSWSSGTGPDFVGECMCFLRLTDAIEEFAREQKPRSAPA